MLDNVSSELGMRKELFRISTGSKVDCPPSTIGSSNHSFQLGFSSGKSKGKRVFSLAGGEYGYRDREIGEYLKKDPTAVTGYLQHREGLREELEKVVEDPPFSNPGKLSRIANSYKFNRTQIFADEHR